MIRGPKFPAIRVPWARGSQAAPLLAAGDTPPDESGGRSSFVTNEDNPRVAIANLGVLPRGATTQVLWAHVTAARDWMRHRDPDVRAEAAQTLAALTRQLVRSRDMLAVGDWLAEALARERDPKPLAEMARAFAPVVLHMEASAAQDDRWVRLVEPLLTHAAPSVRAAAMETMVLLLPCQYDDARYLGFFASLALIHRIHTIDPRLRADDRHQRLQALREIATVSPQLAFDHRRRKAQMVMELVADEDPIFRAAVARALARIAVQLPATRDRFPPALLLKALTADADAAVVVAAVEGLASLAPLPDAEPIPWGDRVALPALVARMQALTTHPHPQVRDAAAAGLATLAPLLDDDRERLTAFDAVAALRDDPAVEPVALVRGMGQMLPALALPHQASRTSVLEELARSSTDPDVQQAAVRALENQPHWQRGLWERMTAPWRRLMRFFHIGQDLERE